MTTDFYLGSIHRREFIAHSDKSINYFPTKDLLNDQFRNFDIIHSRKITAEEILHLHKLHSPSAIKNFMLKLKRKWFKQSIKVIKQNNSIFFKK